MVNVKYHWALFKNDRKQTKLSLDKDSDFYFKITPDQGTF